MGCVALPLDSSGARRARLHPLSVRLPGLIDPRGPCVLRHCSTRSLTSRNRFGPTRPRRQVRLPSCRANDPMGLCRPPQRPHIPVMSFVEGKFPLENEVHALMETRNAGR